MSTPLMTHLPRSGFSRPIIDLRNTDLPVPDGPSITLTSPGGRVNVRSRQMVCRPKDFVRPSTTTSAPIDPPELEYTAHVVPMDNEPDLQGLLLGTGTV